MKINYPDSLTIQQYIEGKLDPKLMHELEKRAMDDPFLFEALEGYENTADPQHNLSILQRQLQELIVHLQENKKVFDLTWKRLSVAAAAAVMFISAGILFWMHSQKQDTKLASNIKQVETNLTPADTLKANLNQPVNPSPKENSSLKKDALVANLPPTVKPSVTLADKPATSENLKKNQLASVSAKDAAFGLKNKIADLEDAKKEPLTASSTEIKAKPEDPVTGSLTTSDFKKLSGIAETTGVFSKSKSTPAQPTTGWSSYKQYLEQNTHQLKDQPIVKGKVKLSFWVNQDGKLTSFYIIKGLSDAYNAEAIRLIKDGPSWKADSSGIATQITVIVTFK